MKAVRWLVVLLLVLAVIPLTAKPVKATDPWAPAYGDWQYRTAVTISNPNSADLTDFQVKVVLDSNWPGWARVKEDGSDIRFATADGTTIPYWIESWDYSGQSAVIWIKVPSIPANGETTVYMYYGNSQAASESNGEAVFEFFDDFDGTELDTNKWDIYNSPQISISNSVLTISGTHSITTSPEMLKSKATFGAGYVLEARVNQDFTGSSHGGIGFAEGNGYTYPPSTNVAMYVDASGSSSDIRFLTEDGANRNYNIPGSYTGGWTRFMLKRGSSSVYFKFASYEWTSTQYPPSGDLPIHIGGYQSDAGSAQSFTMQVDWIRVRKYAEQEPTLSFSAIEEMNSGGYTVTLSLKDDAGNSLNGVDIYVDGSLAGTYNDGDSITISTEGTHTIRGEKAGYVPTETSVDITSGTTSYTASLTLTEIPQPAITVDPSSPKLSETISITLSAEAKAGFTVSYKYRLEDGSGTVLVDWTADSDGQFTYTIPQSLAHGTLVIRAKTVYDDGTGQYESLESSTSISIANSPPSAPTLSVSPGTVATAGDTITATASGSSDPDGDPITYEYKFEDVTDGVVLQDWSTTNSYTTTTDQAGHVIRVWARAYDGYDYSNEVYVDVNLNNHPPTAPTSLTLSSGLHVGKQVTITASGSTDEDGDDISYEYRIVDSTTGAVIRDWSSTNTWTPSSGQLYHTIEIFARAVDSKGAASDAVSRVYFVLPGETIVDVPFDPGQVKSKVIFTLSSAWTDVTGLKVKLDGKTSGAGTLFLFASFNGIHWWANITGDKVTLYSDSPYGPFLVPELTYDKIGTSLWAKDYVQKLVDFAQQAGTLEGTAIGSGTYVQSYDAYIAGIAEEAIVWWRGGAWTGGGTFGAIYSRTMTCYNTPGIAILPTSVAEGYLLHEDSWAEGDAYVNWYDYDESKTENPEFYQHDGSTSGRISVAKVWTGALTGLDSWQTNRSFNFYIYLKSDFHALKISWRLVSVASKDANITTLQNHADSAGDTFVTINVKPLPVPTKVTFWFYDENNNPLNGVDVYLGNTFLGTFDSGQSYQLDYAGTYTFTAKKLHYVDTTVTTYVEGNAGVSFTLPLQSYDVTVRITDENNNPLSATLYIDGNPAGTGEEFNVTLKYGSHTFKAVDSEGYSGETTELIDHDGQVVTVTIEHPVTVTFKIYDSNSSAELTGVTLYVDGASYRVINSGDQLQFLRGLHSFKFEKDGYLTTTLTINLQSDTTLTVFLLPGSDSEEGLGTWPGMNISQWNITPINSYAKALIDSGGMFGDTIKNAIRADPLMKLLLPQLLILAIVIFILVQTQSPIAGIGGALIMQAMFTAILGEAPNLRNSSLTFMLIVFLAAWTMWDLFVNYSRET